MLWFIPIAKTQGSLQGKISFWEDTSHLLLIGTLNKLCFLPPFPLKRKGPCCSLYFHLCHNTCSWGAWLGPLQLLDNFLHWALPEISNCTLMWSFTSHEAVASCLHVFCMASFFLFFLPPLFFALPMLFSFTMFSNTHPWVHSTSPAWSITVTATPWPLLPSQFYIQSSILPSVPYLLTL